MNNPNFFCGVDVLNALPDMDVSKGFEGPDLTMDLIEAPYWFRYAVTKKTVTMQAFLQMDLYSKSQPSGIDLGTVKMDVKTGNVSIKTAQQIEDNIEAFFAACLKLSRYAAENIPQEAYADLDPEEAGILLEEKDGEIVWKVVSGKERPELTCQTLMGGVTTCRPYMEDFWERSMIAEMDADALLQAAENGDELAMEKLFTVYENGDEDRGIEPDPEQAVYWLKRLADAGSAIGMFNLGLHTAKGFGTPRDFAAAAAWMEKAAEAGDDDAPTLVKEYRKLAEAEEKAKSGDAKAMTELANGLMMLGGSLDQAGADDDFAECLKWARKSADLGCADAYWPLALAYEHGRGVEEDVDKAIEYYRRGAELGSAACQHSYACYFLRGENVESDPELAIEWLEKSAAQGYGLAYRTLGHVYETGEFADPDLDLELEYFEKACLALPNDAELLRHVGFQYMNLMDEEDDEKWLRGVERAVHWLRKAADLGNPAASGSTFERILELHRQGVIPAGTSFEDCLKYLHGDGEGGEGEDDEDDEEFEEDEYMTGIVPDALSDAWRFEDELDKQGYLPDLPHGVETWVELPRTHKKAEEGDKKAKKILAAWEKGMED